MPITSHRLFEDLLKHRLEGRRKISRARLGDVLYRLAVAVERMAPSQTEIVQGTMLKVRYGLAADAVSRATAALDEAQLITALETRKDRPGRPYTPLQLGSPQWAMVGVKVNHEIDHSASLSILVTGLDGHPIDLDSATPPQPAMVVADPDDDLRQHLHHEDLPADADLVERIAAAVERLCALPGARDRYILGIGVEMAGHVYEGRILTASAGKLDGVKLGPELSDRLDKLAGRLDDFLGIHTRLPVIVDNDVNVLATLQTYTPDFPESDVAVVAVFDDGIGSALVVNDYVYRGGHGAAGELGHLPALLGVDEPHPAAAPRHDPDTGEATGFARACLCGKTHHVDCYGPPRRIMQQLGRPVADFAAVASEGNAKTEDGQLTEEGQVFGVAGRVLGAALACGANIVDPQRIVLFVPEVLVAPRPGSPAAAYVDAMNDAFREHAFFDPNKPVNAEVFGAPENADGIITRQALGVQNRRARGAKAAAVRVVDSFIRHAKHRCTCYEPPHLASQAN